MVFSNIRIKKNENNYNLRNNYLKKNTPIKKLEHNYDLRYSNIASIKNENNYDLRNNYLNNNIPITKYENDCGLRNNDLKYNIQVKKYENNNHFQFNEFKTKYNIKINDSENDNDILKNNIQSYHLPISLHQKYNSNYDYDDNLIKEKEYKTYNIDYLYNEIKNLQNQLNEEKQKNIKLEKELNLAKKELEKIIAINFISVDQRINYPMKCKDSDIFLKLEEKLYHEFPDIKNQKVFFMAKGILINKNDTLDKYNIKSGDSILVNIN